MGNASFKARWAVMPAGGTFNGSTPTWDFISDTLQKSETILVGQGLRGYRQKQTEQERSGLYDVAGTLTANPSAAFLSFWLPYVMGGGTATAPTLQPTVPAFDIICDRADGVYKYASCKVNKFSLKFSSGQLATCSLDIIGMTEATATWAGAALGSTIAYEPFQAADVSFQLDAGDPAVEELELTIDNALSPKRRMQLTNSAILETGREVMLRGKSVMRTAELALLYGVSATPDTGCTVNLVNTRGASSVSAGFTFSRVRFPDRTGLPDGDEFLIPFEGLCRGTAAGVEFTASLDITP
jgi:hypothetical protein